MLIGIMSKVRVKFKSSRYLLCQTSFSFLYYVFTSIKTYIHIQIPFFLLFEYIQCLFRLRCLSAAIRVCFFYDDYKNSDVKKGQPTTPMYPTSCMILYFKLKKPDRLTSYLIF
jgi:hypothetical protein